MDPSLIPKPFLTKEEGEPNLAKDLIKDQSPSP